MRVSSIHPGGAAPCHLFASTLPPTPDIYTLSLHDALPILGHVRVGVRLAMPVRQPVMIVPRVAIAHARSEEHTSELQSHSELVCRLLLEKKNVSLLSRE